MQRVPLAIVLALISLGLVACAPAVTLSAPAVTLSEPDAKACNAWDSSYRGIRDLVDRTLPGLPAGFTKSEAEVLMSEYRGYLEAPQGIAGAELDAAIQGWADAHLKPLASQDEQTVQLVWVQAVVVKYCRDGGVNVAPDLKDEGVALALGIGPFE